MEALLRFDPKAAALVEGEVREAFFGRISSAIGQSASATTCFHCTLIATRAAAGTQCWPGAAMQAPNSRNAHSRAHGSHQQNIMWDESSRMKRSGSAVLC